MQTKIKTKLKKHCNSVNTCLIVNCTSPDYKCAWFDLVYSARELYAKNTILGLVLWALSFLAIHIKEHMELGKCINQINMKSKGDACFASTPKFFFKKNTRSHC